MTDILTAEASAEIYSFEISKYIHNSVIIKKIVTSIRIINHKSSL